MTGGLRFLPRVQADRMSKRREGAPELVVLLETMDCPTCQEHQTDADRAALRCGWMRASDWRTEELSPHQEEVCPGYTTQLPDVIEAARLLQWRNHGGLAALVDELPLSPRAATCVDILDASVREIESEMMHKATEKARG